jgi:RNA polymerase II subunit A-like phosphatase
MEDCSHQVQYNGLCAVCGAVLENLSDEEKINMSYDNIGLTVSRSEAERLEKENAKRLLESRKLSLILDLDQTIVHASCDPRISHWKNEEIRQFTLPKSPTMYYIKLRPGLREFLKEIENLYDLHIYTMGTKDYAKAVAREMDPEGSLFKERILSRDENGCKSRDLYMLFLYLFYTKV